MKKRILAFAVSLVIIFGALPTFALADSKKTVEFSVGMEISRYSDLTTAATGLEDYIVSNLLACKTKIDLSGYDFVLDNRYVHNQAQLGTHIVTRYPQLNIQAYVNKYPDLYNISSLKYDIADEYVGGAARYYIKSITPSYYYDYKTYSSYNTAYKAASEIFISDLVDSDLSDLEKALLLHDRLAVHCEYDYENYCADTIPDDSFNMYGTMINRISVCQGYAKSYQYMLDLLGIENRLCISEDLVHVWNIITVNGEDYHVDITWDDPVYNVSGRAMHDNFMLSSEAAYYSDHEANDYDTTPTDTTYDNYFWQDSETAFCLVKNKIYYIDNSKSDLMLWENGESSIVYDFGNYHSYTKLASYKGKLYYLYQNKVYAYDPDTPEEEPTVVYTPNVPWGYNAYGFEIQRGCFIIDSYDNYGDEDFVRDTEQIEPEIDITEDLQTALKRAVKNRVYNGSQQTVSLSLVHDGYELIENLDYTLSYKSNINVGTATVTVTAQNGFTGTATATFKITPISIASAKISNISDKAYTGSAITQAPFVALGGKYLTSGRDFVLSYSSNKSTGRATVTVKGKGNYGGSVTRYFYIHPKKVTGVALSSAKADYIKIKWSKAPSGTGYAVRRKTSKNGSFKTIAIINSLKTTSYTDKKVSANKTYYYDVVAFKTVSGKKYSSVASSLLTAKTATKAPKISYYKNTSSKKAKIKWKKVSGATGYQLYMSTKKGSGYKRIYSGGKLSYTKSKLKKGKTYYFKLRTYKTLNGKKIYSSYSSVKKVKIKK